MLKILKLGGKWKKRFFSFLKKMKNCIQLKTQNSEQKQKAKLQKVSQQCLIKRRQVYSKFTSNILMIYIRGMLDDTWMKA